MFAVFHIWFSVPIRSAVIDVLNVFGSVLVMLEWGNYLVVFDVVVVLFYFHRSPDRRW